MYKMKKLLAVLIVSLLALSALPGTALAADDITVFINGVHMEFDVDPVVEDGRVLVPMRAIFEALGATVSWDNDSRMAVASKGDTILSITIDSPTMIKNREPIPMDVPARIVGTRTMVPVRAISEGLGADVKWDGEHKWVLITMPEEKNTFKLTDADMETLKSRYEIIRYNFEQTTLSSAMFESADVCISCINDKLPNFLGIPYSLWASNVTSNIIYIMTTSDSTYEMSGEMTMDDITESCEKIMMEAGLYPTDIFDVYYVTLESGQNVFIMDFYDTDSFMACKYIGVTVDKNNKLRFFTAETDPFTDYIFLCEVTERGHGIWGVVDSELYSFLYAIDDVLQGGSEMSVSIER